jgi:hypothetical protein
MSNTTPTETSTEEMTEEMREDISNGREREEEAGTATTQGEAA